MVDKIKRYPSNQYSIGVNRNDWHILTGNERTAWDCLIRGLFFKLWDQSLCWIEIQRIWWKRSINFVSKGSQKWHTITLTPLQIFSGAWWDRYSYRVYHTGHTWVPGWKGRLGRAATWPTWRRVYTGWQWRARQSNYTDKSNQWRSWWGWGCACHSRLSLCN